MWRGDLGPCWSYAIRPFLIVDFFAIDASLTQHNNVLLWNSCYTQHDIPIYNSVHSHNVILYDATGSFSRNVRKRTFLQACTTETQTTVWSEYSLSVWRNFPSLAIQNVLCENSDNITKTCLYNFDPLKSHYRIVKRGFTGVYIISWKIHFALCPFELCKWLFLCLLYNLKTL